MRCMPPAAGGLGSERGGTVGKQSSTQKDAAAVRAAHSGAGPLLAFMLCEGDSEELSNQRQVCKAAAAGGHLAVLQLARQRGCPWGEETCGVAAIGGHLAVLQWARQQGCHWNKETAC